MKCSAKKIYIGKSTHPSTPAKNTSSISCTFVFSGIIPKIPTVEKFNQQQYF